MTKFGNARAADELEKFTHNLCYLYGRATRAVSICPPAYYADLICTRARSYLSEFFDAAEMQSNDDAESKKGGKGGGGGGGGAALSGMNTDVHPKLKNSMYYI